MPQNEEVLIKDKQGTYKLEKGSVSFCFMSSGSPTVYTFPSNELSNIFKEYFDRQEVAVQGLNVLENKS